MFFDLTEGKFIAINSDSQEYVGHEFAKVTPEGKVVPVKVSRIYNDGKATKTFAPQCRGYLNYLAGGFISGNDGQLGLCNTFEFDTNKMRYDADKKAEDLSTYGKISYETLKGIMSREFFDANHCEELKVAIDKGLISIDDFEAYIRKLAWCFLENKESGAICQ